MNDTLYIILVEDDADDRQLFIDALKASGKPYKLEWAARCDDFFEMLKQGENPDIIFIDINLPGTNGHACVKQLKADDRYKDIPLLIYSGSKSSTDVERAYEEGAHYYVIKPYVSSNLNEALKKVFEIDWKNKPVHPERNEFVINTAFV